MEARVVVGQAKAEAALAAISMAARHMGTTHHTLTHFCHCPAGLKRNKKQQLTMRSGPGVGYVHILIPEGT